MLSEQILIFFQIVFIDLVLAGDNAIIIGMVASQSPPEKRKNNFFWDWCGCGLENCFYFDDRLFASNYRFKTYWRNSITLYML